MATITYTAKRSVAGGRTVGEEYTFEVPISDWTPRPRRQVASSTSLSGRRFERLTRIDREWRVSTVAEDDEAKLAQLEEFLDSVAEAIGAAVTQSDGVLLAETVDELSTYERTAVWARLSGEQQEAVKELRTQQGVSA